MKEDFFSIIAEFLSALQKDLETPQGATQCDELDEYKKKYEVVWSKCNQLTKENQDLKALLSEANTRAENEHTLRAQTQMVCEGELISFGQTLDNAERLVKVKQDKLLVENLDLKKQLQSIRNLLAIK